MMRGSRIRTSSSMVTRMPKGALYTLFSRKARSPRVSSSGQFGANTDLYGMRRVPIVTMKSTSGSAPRTGECAMSRLGMEARK